MTFMIANVVVAQGILTIIFAMIWAFHLFQVRPVASAAVRWVFFFMLLYTWTFLIPTCGDVLSLIKNYEQNRPADFGLSKHFWYTDKYFLVSCIPLAAFPGIAYFLARIERINNWFSRWNEKPFWSIITGSIAVFLALWIVAGNYLIEYTGKPCDPVIIENVKWFAPPYVAQALLIIFFSLVEALSVFCLPPNNNPNTQAHMNNSEHQEM